jgi:hypothetical protein
MVAQKHTKIKFCPSTAPLTNSVDQKFDEALTFLAGL